MNRQKKLKKSLQNTEISEVKVNNIIKEHTLR